MMYALYTQERAKSRQREFQQSAAARRMVREAFGAAPQPARRRRRLGRIVGSLRASLHLHGAPRACDQMPC